MSRESPGLMVHREEDPGESSTERTRRPAGSGETVPLPFLSLKCRPSAVCEGLLRPGKGPPEEVGRQHSAHERSRTVPTLSLETREVVDNARSHQPETWEVTDDARFH